MLLVSIIMPIKKVKQKRARLQRDALKVGWHLKINHLVYRDVHFSIYDPEALKRNSLS